MMCTLDEAPTRRSGKQAFTLRFTSKFNSESPISEMSVLTMIGREKDTHVCIEEPLAPPGIQK